MWYLVSRRNNDHRLFRYCFLVYKTIKSWNVLTTFQRKVIFILIFFIIKKEVEICKRTHRGGCDKLTEIKLSRHNDRNYTVMECYDLCATVPECEGFLIITEHIVSCLLVREGCVKNERPTREYYAMADCMTANSNSFEILY